MTGSNAIGIMAALGSAFSWAIGAVIFKRLGATLSSFGMTLVKGTFSVILLGFFTMITETFAPISKETLFYLVLSGVLGIALSDTFFFSALKSLSPQAIALLFSLGQVITILMAVIFLGEKLSFPLWVGITFIIAGVSVGIFPGCATRKRSSLRGILLGLASILLMSIAVIFTKKGLAEVSPLFATFIRMLSGTTGMLLLGITTRRLDSWITPFKDVQLIRRFALAVSIITFGGFWLSAVALKHTNVAVATSLISTDSILVLPISSMFLNEKITRQAAAGALITIAGIFILCFYGLN